MRAWQKLSGKEYLTFISDEPLHHGRKIYGERYGIEVSFGTCKTHSIFRVGSDRLKRQLLNNPRLGEEN